MDGDEARSLGDRFAEWLAAYDEAVAEGRTPPTLAGDVSADPELRRHLEQARELLQLVQHVLPLMREDAPGGPSREGGGPDDSRATWIGLEPDVPAFPAPGLGIREATGSLGRFEILGELGRGGFGVVFLALDPELGRKVALKVPRAEVLAGPEGRRRSLREAQAAAGLDHPNLVPVFEAGQVGSVCYIASAYCDGISLAEWIRRREGPMPPRQAAALVAPVADAIQHAHDRGILHRDLKPGNVLLQRAPGPSCEGLGAIPRVTDFGLAKLVDQPEDDTLSGLPIGSPPYMAPEQAEGRTDAVGPGTDIYALGAILYELLTGRPPHRGESALETIRRVIAEDPAPPRRLRPDVPRGLEAIVLKCLEKQPSLRYATASALAADLRRFLGGEPVLARPAGPLGRAWLWARHPSRIAQAGALMMGYAAFVICWNVCGMLAVFVFGVISLERPAEFASSEAVTTLFDLVPTFWLGWLVRKGWTGALWPGFALSLVRLVAQVTLLLWPVSDFGGLYGSPETRWATLLGIVLLTVVVLGGQAIGLLAWGAARGARRAAGRPKVGRPAGR